MIKIQFMYNTLCIYILKVKEGVLKILNNMFFLFIFREEWRDLTQCYDKSPYTDRKIQKATWPHKNATKKFDYTTIADRLKTVSWGNNIHPTGVVKPVYGIQTFPLTQKQCNKKNKHLFFFK